MPKDGGGVVGNLRGLAANGVRAVRTRLELVAIELQLEKARVVRKLLLAAATFYLLSFGMLAALLWIAMTVPEASRGIALGGIALGFFALGIGGALWLLYGDSQAKPLLATTIGVLKGDEHALTGPKA